MKYLTFIIMLFFVSCASSKPDCSKQNEDEAKNENVWKTRERFMFRGDR